MHLSESIIQTHPLIQSSLWNQTHMRKGVEANNRHPHLKGKHFCPIEAKKAPGERLQHMQERLTWRYWVVLPDWSTSLFNCLTWIEHKNWLKPSSYLPIVLSDHLMQCIYHTNASPYTIVSLKSNPHAERSRSQQPTSSFERETLLPYRSEESTWGEVAAHARALDVLPDWSIYFTLQLFDIFQPIVLTVLSCSDFDSFVNT